MLLGSPLARQPSLGRGRGNSGDWLICVVENVRKSPYMVSSCFVGNVMESAYMAHSLGE